MPKYYEYVTGMYVVHVCIPGWSDSDEMPRPLP